MPDYVKLHLGCYNVKIPGYINVDIRPEVKPDVVEDVFKLESFKDNSADIIYICHVLEHASREEALAALQRYYQILKPGGILRVAVPDIEACIQVYTWTGNLDFIRSSLWGSQRHDYDYHKAGWDFNALKNDLQQIGFGNIYRYNWWNTEHAKIDDYSSAYYPYKITPQSKNTSLLISLNVEARKLNCQ